MNQVEKMRLAQRLKVLVSQDGGSASGNQIINARAASDSSGGLVSVIIGEPEYDEQGREVVSLEDVTVEVPVIGGATEGDDVLVSLVNGNPVAVGAGGWGASVQAMAQAAMTATAYLTPVEEGPEAGLHVHEDRDDYNSGFDFWINPAGAAIRNNGETVATFGPSSTTLCGGRAKFAYELTPATETRFESGMLALDSTLFPIAGNEENVTRGFLEFHHDFNGGLGNGAKASAVLKAAENTYDEAAEIYKSANATLTLRPGARPFFSSYLNSLGHITNESGDVALMADIPEPLPFCKGVRTAYTTTSSTASQIADVPLQQLEYNSGGFTLSGGGIVMPRAGIVKITGAVHYSSVASSAQAGCYIYKNSSELTGDWSYGENQPNAVTVAFVSAGDVIYLRSRNSTRSATVDYQSGGGFKNTQLVVEYLELR